ncbi:MAG: protein translocase subunit SecD [Solirubrobacteraceae bacterium]
MTDRQRHGLVLLVVAGLIAASAVAIAIRPTRLGLDLKGGVELVYQAVSTPGSPVNSAAMQRAVNVMNDRVNQLGVTQAQIQTEGKNLIDVQLPDVTNVVQAEKTVGNTAQLYFYDWEANVINPSTGQVVANGLLSGNSQAIAISQGSATSEPGGGAPASGALSFYKAVKLASTQPYRSRISAARYGNEFFLFGDPGGTACKAAAAASLTTAGRGVHCLIGQPLDVGASITLAQATRQLEKGLSKAETTGVQVLEVKQGTQVLQAAPASFAKWPKYGSPNAGYYVIRDNVALRGSDISNPEANTDQAGQPDVVFGFKGNGGNIFQNVTGKIALRGSEVSIGGQTLDQHFAITLDNQIVSVPSIDFKTYPDGIPSTNGSEITGGFTASTAAALATQLRLGALPVKLTQISENQVSSTLGAQALNQGLIAGAVGLALVVLLLVFYYRVLGVVAVGGLVTYGVYFFALIKLVPITMTLAGIAGLILTIGVAADANVVIFERVKEEIRAGRSIRQGIITGYRKGITAIIDANVVTIMTAFILFVLATSDVKGFAFTLGIGTFVSLFTAVLATQAILVTMGDSRTIQSPAALGAGGHKRHWRFDFMGASRYFFSLSGLILLTGALAIGGRGLHLGIDFTSGTEITIGLASAASVAAVKALVVRYGGGTDATVQQVTSKILGHHGFQIQAHYLSRVHLEGLRSALVNHFGLYHNTISVTTVGPSFGSAVTHSAVVAIIVSLIVISLYVALRFEWKFTVPVLIALMHDVLITAGVYALTGRTVTADTVAALLTILGYSLYDTIIVFDRVRENIPRMPRAAFSQIVNRSMSEVLTRSLITTSSTLLPVVALLVFGGPTLKDFAFALLIGVASGAYSSIFIASPVLTHWKEREQGYRLRRARIIERFGAVPAYAEGADVEPAKRPKSTAGLVAGTVDDQNLSSEEFARLTKDLGLEEDRPGRRRTSWLSERSAHITDEELDEPEAGGPADGPADVPAGVGGIVPRRPFTKIPTRANPARGQSSAQGRGAPPARGPASAGETATPSHAPAPDRTESESVSSPSVHVGDQPENDGVAKEPKRSSPRSSKPRNRRHGRKR